MSDGGQLIACDRCKGHFAYLYRKKVSCRGRTICVPRSRKRIICVPRYLLHVYRLHRKRRWLCKVSYKSAVIRTDIKIVSDVGNASDKGLKVRVTNSIHEIRLALCWPVFGTQLLYLQTDHGTRFVNPRVTVLLLKNPLTWTFTRVTPYRRA